MTPLRFGIIGSGFWSQYQLAGWREMEGAQCVAVCDCDRARAASLASTCEGAAVYDSAQAMMERENLDFIDIVTPPDSHGSLVEMAARHGLAVICQKPLAPTLEEARRLVTLCRDEGVPLFIHENWRWQPPIRELQRVLASGVIGRPFFARVEFSSSFSVFESQPLLKQLDQFIIADMGSHLLDVCRVLFGEAESLVCQTHRMRPDIRGEDVATVMMPMGATRTSVVCHMSYASRTERERFPETFIFVEGEHGSVELAPDYWLRVTTPEGTQARRVQPPFYPWADPRHAVVHASIVECHRNLLDALRHGRNADTHAADNLETLKLVFAAYESARENRAIHIAPETSTPNL